jgi:hypothetical protein
MEAVHGPRACCAVISVNTVVPVCATSGHEEGLHVEEELCHEDKQDDPECDEGHGPVGGGLGGIMVELVQVVKLGDYGDDPVYHE